MREIAVEPRTLQFVLLVLQLALGENGQPVAAFRQLAQGMLHLGKRRGRQLQQLFAMGQQFGQFIGRNLFAAYAQGSLYHRDGERLAAIPQVGHVAALGLEEFRLGVVAIGGDEPVEMLLHMVEMRLAVPQRIVGIECNYPYVLDVYHVNCILKYPPTPNTYHPTPSSICSMRSFIVPAGTRTSTTSPTFLFSKACAMGDLMEILPSRRFASWGLAMV